MKTIISLYCSIDTISQRLLTPILPLMARLGFAATLLLFFLNSAKTKFGNSLLSPSIGGYGQILPNKAALVNYNTAGFKWLDWLIVMAGTYGEIILPILIVAGLMTRVAALGMIGFIIVMTFVDVTGHGVMIGALFDRHSNGIIDQRLFWILMLLIIAGCGAGRFSLDHILSRKISARRS